MLRAPALLLLLPLTLTRASAPAYAPRNGDLVFQTSRSPQSAAVQAATHSTYSHMGIVYLQSAGEAFVFEAVDPVQSTPLRDWIARGEGGRFVVKRLRDADRLLTPVALERMKAVGDSLKGRPYDLTFEWSDDRIYCSELVWKIYQRGLGIELGQRQKLCKFDFSDPGVRALAHKRWGGDPPCDEQAISPAAMFASKRLVTVYAR